MRTIILLLMLLWSAIIPAKAPESPAIGFSAPEQYDNTITITNGRYEPIRVDIFFNGAEGLMYYASLSVPGGESVTMGLGYHEFYNFYYRVNDDVSSMMSFYSDQITIY